MSQTNLDIKKSEEIIKNIIAKIKTKKHDPTHEKSLKIKEILEGDNITYHYILITNLLAKATNSEINGLALQAGADIPGSFDSRSLCHKVIVKLDMDSNFFNGKMGRSNEPYLNKPARYKTLDTKNPTKGKKHQKILDNCIDILSNLQDSVDATSALEDAIFYIMQRSSSTVQVTETLETSVNHKKFMDFAEKVITVSNEGESCVLLAAVAIFILTNNTVDIQVHPTNQSGASSREILDIDVYSKEGHVYSIEVKDKNFEAKDLQHAANKAKSAGLERFFFIYGPQCKNTSEYTDYIKSIESINIRLIFMSILEFYSMCLSISTYKIQPPEFWSFLDKKMQSARVKIATKNHILKCAQECDLISIV